MLSPKFLFDTRYQNRHFQHQKCCLCRKQLIQDQLQPPDKLKQLQQLQPIINSVNIPEENRQDPINQKRYSINIELGRGGQGIVYEGFEPISNKKVAIKCINSKNNQKHDVEIYTQLKDLVKESLITLKDIHLSEMLDSYEYDGNFYQVFELYHHDLLYHIDDVQNKLNPNNIIKVLYQSLIALSKLHSVDIIHWDIKPENIMIDNDLNVQIVDFGLAKTKERLQTQYFSYGTTRYSAPEIQQGKLINHKVDIWALGCVLYELITGQIFSINYNGSSNYTKNVQGLFSKDQRLFSKDQRLLTQIKDDLDLNKKYRLIGYKIKTDICKYKNYSIFINIIQKMFRIDPAFRPSASDLLKDDLFRDIRAQSVNTQTIDTQTVNTQIVNIRSIDTQTDDIQTVNTQSIDTQTDDIQTDDIQTVDTQIVDTQIVDNQTKQTRMLQTIEFNVNNYFYKQLDSQILTIKEPDRAINKFTIPVKHKKITFKDKSKLFKEFNNQHMLLRPNIIKMINNHLDNQHQKNKNKANFVNLVNDQNPLLKPKIIKIIKSIQNDHFVNQLLKNPNFENKAIIINQINNQIILLRQKDAQVIQINHIDVVQDQRIQNKTTMIQDNQIMKIIQSNRAFF